MSGFYIAKTSFMRNRIYLMNHLVNNLGSIVFGYIYVSIWRALLGNTPQGSEMVTYVMVNQAGLWINMFLPYGAYIPQKMRDGSIAYELLRPYDLIYSSFAETTGHIIYNLFFRSMPIFLFGIIFLNVNLPKTERIIPYMITLFLSYIVAFLLNYFVGLWSLVHIEYSAAQMTYYFLMNTFGGSFISREYYPKVIREIFPYLPFASSGYMPGAVYTGKIYFWNAIIVQIIWIVILSSIAYILTNKLYYKIKILGG